MKKLHFWEIILFGSMVYIFFISSSVCNGHILSPKHSLFQAQCLNYFPFLISNSSNRVCDRINYQSFSQVHDFYLGIIFSSTLRTLREILSKIKSPIVIRILLRSSYIIYLLYGFLLNLLKKIFYYPTCMWWWEVFFFIYRFNNTTSYLLNARVNFSLHDWCDARAWNLN